MVRAFFLLLCALVSGVVQAIDLSIDAWSSRCVEEDKSKSLNCGVPIKVIHPPFVQTLPVSELVPSNAKQHVLPVQVIPSKDGDLKYELRIWEVFPKTGLRYYQVQVEWISPARSTCMLSVDASKTQWPPLTCVSYDPNSGVRYGLLVQTKN